MPHVPSPVLRRLADDPLAVPDHARRHVASCSRCRAHGDEMAAAAALASQLLTAPQDIGDADLEWIMLTERLREPGLSPAPAAAHQRRMPRPLTRVSLGAAAAVAGAVIAVGAGAAVALTTVFAPTHVAPVRVSASELQEISDITGLSSGQLSGQVQPSGSVPLSFGRLSWTTSRNAQQASSVAQARALTQLAFTTPASLPAGVGPRPSIEVLPQVTATVTVSKSAGGAVGGSTLQLTAGPAIVAQYGDAGGSGTPTLEVVAMRRPEASSTGATASQLETFLLTQRGMPARLAEEIRLLGNPRAVLPVPVPAGMSEQQLTVGGAAAVLVTDRSGAASGVIWESRDGIVHGVGGLLDSADVLSVARQVG